MVRNRNQVYLLLGLILLLLLVSFLSLTLGTVQIPLSTSCKILVSHLPFVNISPTWTGTEETILLRLRLPRIIMCLVIGAGLSTSGIVLQGVLRNPLADPFILGASSGAALGATVAISMKIHSSVLLLPLFAFIGALAAMFFVYNLARTGGKIPIHTLLLSGVIVNAFLSAIGMFIMSISRKEAQEILFWLMGSLSQVDINMLKFIFIYTAIGLVIVYLYSRELNIMALGEEQAYHLGVEVERLKKILFFVLSLIIGAGVSLAGMIGFVGLIIPHIMRMLVGPDHRILIPAGVLGGGIFLILSDTVARTILPPIELPVGVITALAGAPFFIYLLRKGRKVV
ncbi:MAG: iron chelate uptake ABC transporter family permease subunit [Candidatus Omnitrophica bacterium]|nr:iron chelate uptake ABC transporter family permease subunit [Candidatus Omnitrophota bacterium]